MATGKRTYGSQVWIEGDGTPTWTTLSGTTEEFTSAIDNTNNGYDMLILFPEVDFDATPTDDVEFAVYGSPDGTDYDDLPLHKITIKNTTDPCQLAVTIMDPPPYIKASFTQTGATDSHNVRCSYVGSRWDVS